jgi:hypothetical protein
MGRHFFLYLYVEGEGEVRRESIWQQILSWFTSVCLTVFSLGWESVQNCRIRGWGSNVKTHKIPQTETQKSEHNERERERERARPVGFCHMACFHWLRFRGVAFGPFVEVGIGRFAFLFLPFGWGHCHLILIRWIKAVASYSPLLFLFFPFLFFVI